MPHRFATTQFTVPALLLVSVACSSSPSGPTPVPDTSVWRTIGAGDAHVCALAKTGRAYCWGDNSFGELGTGDFLPSSTPVKVGGGLLFTGVSVGSGHTCGGVADGTLWCWGVNYAGPLSLADTSARNAPLQIQSIPPFSSFAAGGLRTCIITNDVRLVCWGQRLDRDQNGSLLYGPQPVPTECRSRSHQRALSLGRSTSASFPPGAELIALALVFTAIWVPAQPSPPPHRSPSQRLRRLRCSRRAQVRPADSAPTGPPSAGGLMAMVRSATGRPQPALLRCLCRATIISPRSRRERDIPVGLTPLASPGVGA